MRCSICKEPLFLEGQSYKCKNNHTFDRAKQGYVNLSRKQKDSGDNKEMVKARTQFLEKGYYDFLRDELADLVLSYHPHTLLDIGCGQGYYTQCFQAEKKYGIDLSKEAILYASKKDKSTQYIVDTIYDLPFSDHSIDMALSIFTPLPLEEVGRVLKKDGILITVGPGPYHLYELKELLYPTVLLNPEAAKTMAGFELVDQILLSEKKEIEEVWPLFEMTPYRYHSPHDGIEKVKQIKNIGIRFEFVISIWKKVKS